MRVKFDIGTGLGNGQLRISSFDLHLANFPVAQLYKPQIHQTPYFSNNKILEPISKMQSTSSTKPTNPTCSTTSPPHHGTTLSNETNSTGSNEHVDEPMPDLYGVLGLKHTASHKQVQLAFKKKASQLYPTKHSDTSTAQRQFNAVTNAYSVLSDPARRDDYDQIMHYHFDKQQALETFEKFFKENGILQEEEEFFSKYYPQRKQTDYEVLGLSKKANLLQIQQAYKALAMKYHPKNNPEGDKDAEEKFRRVNQAYFHLKDQFRRTIYDTVVFDKVPTYHAHAQFNNLFLDQQQFEDQTDKKVLGQFVRKTSIREDLVEPPPSPATPYAHHQILDQDDGNHETEIQRQVVQKKGPEGLTTTTRTRQTKYVRGKPKTVITEEVHKPDGTTEVKETVNYLGREETKEFTLKAGEQRPQLKN